MILSILTFILYFVYLHVIFFLYQFRQRFLYLISHFKDLFWVQLIFSIVFAGVSLILYFMDLFPLFDFFLHISFYSIALFITLWVEHLAGLFLIFLIFWENNLKFKITHSPVLL